MYTNDATIYILSRTGVRFKNALLLSEKWIKLER